MRTLLLAPLVILVACSSEHNISEMLVPEEGPQTETTPEPEPEPEPGEPVADAGPDLEASPLDTVTLDGRASYDPSGEEIVAMEWKLVSAPSGSTIGLSDPTSPRPEFFADLAGDYVFDLTVQNESGMWDSTPDQVVVTALPLDGFYVELSWDAGNDLDLHLSQDGAQFYSFQDVSWCNPNPDWGGNGTADDPSLDWDAVDGFGPETITIDEPWDGVYNVRVHYYGENERDSCAGACAESMATVNIYLGGVLVDSFSKLMTRDDQIWHVADIAWPEYRVDEVNEVSSSARSTCR
jgi:hypothetical protein